MKQITLHGEPIKVGDKVWGIIEGWTEVIKLNTKIIYSIQVASLEEYNEDGKYKSKDESPSLFWKEQKFDLSKPETKNKKG